ncbi:unnamed protein product [Phyllotreta striolata]|uniref:Sodium/calcium exchanger membrane region domain-containing protein n=1 Tax=Phyllotreta striolata TaxID=444603 RepID=A0A9P0DZU8_PHYSR|nr:unnamed protein product [Phyllotreta striolata]
MEVYNCTPPAIKEFPEGLFSRHQIENGAIAVHVLVTLYLFIAIATVCDEYFVPVVEKVCRILHVPSDIGGATFMATATSSPELFINIIGTFVTKGDIGLGTIVGSGVFNILAVTAACGLTLAITGKELILDWWPLTRDSLVYAISVCLLIGFLNDEKIEWYEAMTLVLVYLSYIVYLFFDKKVQGLFQGKNLVGGVAKSNEEIKVEEGESEDNSVSLWKWPRDISWIKQALWFINWPINFLFFISIPNSEKLKSNFWIPITFITCILWIGVLSYLLSWMITVIGDILGIPDSVMGITFLAIGAGVPEAASSIAVVKKGKGAMGISNSLGSNTFDILLCLGVPWLLKSTIVSKQKWVNINSSGLQYSTITLLITLVAFYLALTFNKFKLNKFVGLYSLIIYVIFIILATLIELNTFFVVNLPTCKE